MIATIPLAYFCAPLSVSEAGRLSTRERRGMAPEMRRREAVSAIRHQASERVS